MELHPDDLVRIGRGRIDRRWIHNRTSRGYWLTPLPHVSQGKPVTYFEGHAFEVSLACLMRDGGLSEDQAHAVFVARLGTKSSGLQELTELKPPFDRQWYWVIEWAHRLHGTEPTVMRVFPAAGGSSLEQVLQDGHFVSVLDVSQAIYQTLAALEDIADQRSRTEKRRP